MDSALLGLFTGSLLASTIVPGGVEVLLYYLAEGGQYSFVTLLMVASFGNTLGGLISYAMGRLGKKGFNRYGDRFAILQWLRDRFSLQETALQRVRKWGPAALLMSWMPIVGDPLCIAAGFLKLSFWRCFLFIATSKIVRYWLLLWFIFQ